MQIGPCMLTIRPKEGTAKMKNVLYQKQIGPKPDPTMYGVEYEAPSIRLTQEVNGFLISHDDGRGDVSVVEFIFGDQNEAIERAVDVAIEAARPTRPTTPPKHPAQIER